MNMLKLGSINMDHGGEVDHFVRAGKTLAGSPYLVSAGGKRVNQLPAQALKLGCHAAAICVMGAGASACVPGQDNLEPIP